MHTINKTIPILIGALILLLGLEFLSLGMEETYGIDLGNKKPVEVLSTKLSTLETKTYIPTFGDQIDQWLGESGIPMKQWDAVYKLVMRESGWRPDALNSIGACSLVQAYPCSKIGGDWRDPVTALKWGNEYVIHRYGDWFTALQHSYDFNWY
jgi:hypothetical protein